MIKTLRYLSLAVLTFASSYTVAQTTFDFDKAKEMFGTNDESSEYNNDGDFDRNSTATIDGITVTVTASTYGVENYNQVWHETPKLRLYNGNLTVTAPQGKQIKTIVYELNQDPKEAKWASGNAVDKGSLSAYQAGKSTSVTWSGMAEQVVLTIAGDTYLKSLTVTLDGTTGINNLDAGTQKTKASTFNLAGQRVGKGYKGITIKNGQKYIRK